MKRLVFTAAILIMGACPSIAKDHAAEQQLLDSAHKPADLFQGDGNPFDLEIDFIAQFKGPVPGHLSLKWQSKDHWWGKVDVGGFQETLVKNGEMEYTSRNFPYTPLEVTRLFYLLHFRGIEDGLIAEKQKNRVENGISMTCVEAERENYRTETHAVCLDTSSHELLSDEWQESPATTKQQFIDYVDFDGMRYPKKFQLFRDNTAVVSANVSSLQLAPFDPTLLDPPKGAIERRMCRGIKPPKAIKEVHPEFAGAGKSMGQVSMSVTILADGSVGDIRMIHSGGQKIDQIAMDTMRKWKYRPAMCGDDPVVSDEEISLTFKMN
jgi:TonB family protein